MTPSSKSSSPPAANIVVSSTVTPGRAAAALREALGEHWSRVSSSPGRVRLEGHFVGRPLDRILAAAAELDASGVELGPLTFDSFGARE